MTGWKEDMQKVSLTKLQIEVLGLSLRSSKENVDRLLEGAEVFIEAKSLASAKKFVEEANKLGVVCQIDTSKVYKEA